MNDVGVDRAAVLLHLERILSSAPFRQAERSTALLRYVVTRALDGDGDRLKEYTVGVDALGRGPKFDPRTDPVVRAEASRLRSRLDRYYAGDGRDDVVIIELPKGSYVPRFSSGPGERAVGGDEQWPWRRWVWTAIGAGSLAATFAAGAWSARAGAPSGDATATFSVELQSDEEIRSDVGTDVAISPDGATVVYVSLDPTGRSHLRALRFDGSAPVDLPGTAGGRGQFWSPDSRWIAFWAGGQLRKIAINGGAPVVLCDAPDLLGGSWGEDGEIIAALDASNRLWRVDADGWRPPSVALDLDRDRVAPRWPQVLPGGDFVLYTAVTTIGDDRATIEVASLRDGRRQVVVQGGTFGRYVAPGHLTFVNQGTLFAQRFDPRRHTTSGAQVPIVDEVAYSPVFGYAQLSFSANGVAVYRRSLASGLFTVEQVDTAGHRRTVIGEPGHYAWPALSPDGRSLALSVVRSGVPTLGMYVDVDRVARGTWSVPGLDAPVWMRDGTGLVARSGVQRLVWLSPAGGASRTFFESDRVTVPWTFGPADRVLSFAAIDTATAFDVWTVPVERHKDSVVAGTAVPLLQARYYETYPAISPDRQWMAYASSQPEAPGVYVRSLRDTTRAMLVAGAGRGLRWSRSGHELLFTSPNHQVMVVPFAKGRQGLEPGMPRRWSSIRLADTGVLPNFDIGPDDRTIVALLPVRPHPINQVTLITGLPALLRRRAP